MPVATRAALGNEVFDTIIYLPLTTVPNVPASSTTTQVITVSGVFPGDVISWNQQSNVAGLAIENVWVSAINTLTFVWSNATTSAINGTAAQPVLLEVVRPENAALGIATLPSFIF